MIYILNSNSSLILLIIHKTPLDGITMKQTKERQLFRFFFLWTKKEDLHDTSSAALHSAQMKLIFVTNVNHQFEILAKYYF